MERPGSIVDRGQHSNERQLELSRERQRSLASKLPQINSLRYFLLKAVSTKKFFKKINFCIIGGDFSSKKI